MTKLLSAILALFLCLPAYATPLTPETPATPNVRTGEPTVLPCWGRPTCWQAIDGDTVKRGKLRVRAMGYDTPEIRGKCQAEKDLALKAKDRLTELMSPPNRFSLKWGKGRDEFGRGLATFYSNGRPIGPLLIQEGLAHPYTHGKGRLGWC